MIDPTLLTKLSRCRPTASAVTFDDSIVVRHASFHESESEFKKKRRKKIYTRRNPTGENRLTEEIDVYLSRRDVDWFVEDQPDRRFPTTGMRCTALVSHVTGGVR